jgi:dihydrofolate reductase
MRKVILSMHISLDGFVSGPNGELDWVIFDKEVDDAALPDVLARSDTALLGREMYQQFFGYWPSKKPPFFSRGEEEFARWINDVPKVVFSRSLQSVEWNGTLVKGDIAEEVTRLKHQPGKDMLIVGGVGIPQTLVRLGLIDEYRVVVNPVVLGKGKALFADLQDKMNLKLQDSKSFSAGAVLLVYEAAR